MFYSIRIQYKKTKPNGNVITQKEEFLTDNCFIHAEAELKGYAFGAEYQLDEFDVTQVKRSNIREFVNERENEEQIIYRATIIDVFVNDDGMEKELKYQVGIYAKDINEATHKVREYMEQGLNDMRFVEVKETKITDIL